MDVSKRNQIKAPNQVVQVTINLDSNTAESEFVSVESSMKDIMTQIDFPVINENYRYKQYCNFWGVSYKTDGTHFGRWALGKKDLCDPKMDKFWRKPNHYPMEPWFAPKPGATSEDDGVVITTILDGEKGLTYLAILNGTTLEMMNYAYMPIHLPMDFHGQFFEDTF